MSLVDTGDPEERERRWREWLASGGVGPPPFDDIIPGMPQGGLLGGMTNGRLPGGGLLGGGPEEQPERGGNTKRGIAGLLDPNAWARAAAFAYGDFGEAAQIGGMMQQREDDALERLEKQQAEQAQIERIREVGRMNGMSPEQIEAAIVGLKLPEQDKPDAFTRFEQDILPNPERLRNFERYNDITKPSWFRGEDGRPYQNQRGGGLPPGLDPEEWELVPDAGGGVGNGPGRFRR